MAEMHRLRQSVDDGRPFPDFSKQGNSPYGVKQQYPHLHAMFKLLHRQAGIAGHNIEHVRTSEGAHSFTGSGKAIALHTDSELPFAMDSTSVEILTDVCLAMPSMLRAHCIWASGGDQEESVSPSFKIPRVEQIKSSVVGDPFVVQYPLSTLERQRRANALFLAVLLTRTFRIQDEEDDKRARRTEADYKLPPGIINYAVSRTIGSVTTRANLVARLPPIPSSVMGWVERRDNDSIARVPSCGPRFLEEVVLQLYHRLSPSISIDAMIVICNALTFWQFSELRELVKEKPPRNDCDFLAMAIDIFSTYTVKCLVEPNEEVLYIEFLPSGAEGKIQKLWQSRLDNSCIRPYFTQELQPLNSMTELASDSASIVSPPSSQIKVPSDEVAPTRLFSNNRRTDTVSLMSYVPYSLDRANVLAIDDCQNLEYFLAQQITPPFTEQQLRDALERFQSEELALVDLLSIPPEKRASCLEEIGLKLGPRLRILKALENLEG